MDKSDATLTVQFKATGAVESAVGTGVGGVVGTCVGARVGGAVGTGVGVGDCAQAVKRSKPRVIRQTRAKGYFGKVSAAIGF